MALRGASTRITILPVFRRHWVYYCDSRAPPPSTPGERAYAALAARASAQWDELQRAAPGSWRDVARRGAEHVLDASRDPDESFLGAAAGEGDVPVEIVYPASLPERLVRRRLRRLAAARARDHRRGEVLWACALPILAPLLLTPITKLPLFYAAWRWRSHGAARRGAERLAVAPTTLRASAALDAPEDDAVLDAAAADRVVDGSGPHVAHKVRWLRSRGLLPRLPPEVTTS